MEAKNYATQPPFSPNPHIFVHHSLLGCFFPSISACASSTNQRLKETRAVTHHRTRLAPLLPAPLAVPPPPLPATVLRLRVPFLSECAAKGHGGTS